MSNFANIFGSTSVVIIIIESILKLCTYIAVICTLFKVIQALNIYINKNK